MQAARITIGTVALERAEILETFIVAVGGVRRVQMFPPDGENATRSNRIAIGWQGTLVGRDAHARAQVILALARSRQPTRLSLFGDEYEVAVTKFRQRAEGERASYRIECELIGAPEGACNAHKLTVPNKSPAVQSVLRALVRALARQAATALATATPPEKDKP